MQESQNKQENQNGADDKMSNATLEDLVRENLMISREIFEQTKKVRRYILMGQILNAVKIVLIAGPIIIAIIYLPPLIRSMIGTYSDLLGSGTGNTMIEGGGFIQELFGISK